ncbi:MAG: MFS transporter [Bryobacterales bacterium]|nr:MFS transporter [Bryobacterales bacterium]
MSAISYLDRVNISIASSAVQKDFGITDVQMGWVFSAFVWAYALFQAPAGRLADRIGPRLAITLGVLWWSVFTSLTALVPTQAVMALSMLVGVRFVLGMGEAVVYPASNRMVAKWIPTTERGIANGLIFAGVGAGAGVTPPLITYILLNYGWQWSFHACALIGVGAALGWHFLARDVPQGHPFVSAKELAHIEAGIPAADPGAKAKTVVPWSRILGCKDIWFMTLSYFAYGYSAWIFFTWFFRYLSNVRGLDLKASAFYSMLPFIAMAACSPFGGWVADMLTKRYGPRIGRCGIGVVGMAGAAIFIALATQVESARLASFVLACGIGAQYLSQSSYWAVTADVAGGSAGSVSGFMNMGGQIGGAVTAILTPYVAQSLGWTASFMVAAGLCAMGSILWLLVNPAVRLKAD